MAENLSNRYSFIPNGIIHSESSVTPELSEVGDDCDLPVKVGPYNHFEASIMEGNDDLPLPGFRFHPTDEELLGFYLRQIGKISVDTGDIYKYDPWKLPEDKEWYYFCRRGRKYRNSLRPNRVTGSGFWKATGVDKPINSSTVNTSVNNWRNDHKYLRCYRQSPTTSSSEFNSIFNSMNNQQQQFELQNYLVSKCKNGHDCNSYSGETSTSSHHRHVPEFHVDILDGNDLIDIPRGANGHSDLIVYQAWNEYKNQLKNSKFDDDAIKIMSGTFAAVAGQVVAGVIVNRLSSSPSSWAGPVVEAATVLGLSVTLVGITLRVKSRSMSTLVTKLGALTIASAIIFSMGLHLPPAMAWAFGTVAFLIMAVAAALA